MCDNKNKIILSKAEYKKVSLWEASELHNLFYLSFYDSHLLAYEGLYLC